jgi:phosphoribosylamine--glycine ligase
MSKFRLIGTHAESVGLSLRLKQEGHSVSFYVKDPEAKNVYQGIIERVDGPVVGIDKDTIVIMDTVGFGKQADALKKAGYSVYGGSQIADDLELDRSFGIPVAVNAGIEVPKWEEFQDFKAAIKFVEDSDCAWVFKPEHNKDGIQTYVSTSPEMMIKMLGFYKKKWSGGVDFVLQEVVEGTEISSEVWCVNGEIIPNSYNNTLEEKKFFNDNLSQNTGCQSSLVKFNMCPSLFDQTFGKLKPWLKAQRYNGPLDINCIIDRSGTPYFLEWTSRFGYSAIYAFCELLNMPLGEFLSTLSEGKIPDLFPSDEWGGALRVTMPPYPQEDCKETEGKPLIGIELDDEHLFPLDVKLEDGELVTAGYDSVVVEVTGSNSDIGELWDYIYDRAEELEIPDKTYRTDVKESAQKRLDELSDLGLLDESL